jgi:hypothetical protein
MGNNNWWTMCLSGMNQRYNNAKGGNVDKGKIKSFPLLYWHESNTQIRNLIIFPELKKIKFGKTNYLVIHLMNKLKS